MEYISITIICIIIPYLIGSINTSIILSHILKKGDIRAKGSGNAGTTNTMRTIGKRAAACVLLGDMIKGVVSVLVARWLFPGDAQLLAAISVVIGHIFPIYFRFRGGKGVATALASVATLYHGWIYAVILLVIAIPLIIFTKYMSLSVLVAVIAYPILIFTFERGNNAYLVFSLIILLIIYFTHRENIARLISGKENKLSWGGKHE